MLDVLADAAALAWHARESEISGSYGELVVSVRFHKGQPQRLRVIERRPQYRLGGGLVGDDASAR
jgi:hypothetical protein